MSSVCDCGSRPRLAKPQDVVIHALDDGMERSYQLTWSYINDPDAVISPYFFNVRQDSILTAIVTDISDQLHWIG